MQNVARALADWAELPPPVQLKTRARLPISVIIAAKDEAHNLAACLGSLRGAGEVFIIDSQSRDQTTDLAHSFGAQVIQFHYHGGWPKKRQWALDNLPLSYDWVLLLDADESLPPELTTEIQAAISNPNVDGYYIGLDMHFLGRRLRHCGASFYKLSLFRRGKGRFECRASDQDTSMCDMEVHEHVLVSGKCARLRNRLLHRNVESLSRYIQKHNEYSNWEVRVASTAPKRSHPEIQPSLWGTQAQRRRWLRKYFFLVPGSPILYFLFKYLFCLGFLDGVPGRIYCGF